MLLAVYSMVPCMFHSSMGLVVFKRLGGIGPACFIRLAITIFYFTRLTEGYGIDVVS
jgi:hypothetical protein